MILRETQKNETNPTFSSIIIAFSDFGIFLVRRRFSEQSRLHRADWLRRDEGIRRNQRAYRNLKILSDED